MFENLGCEIIILMLKNIHIRVDVHNAVQDARRIVASKKGEVTAGWRKLHNEELQT
jgi:hypothetical protein